MEIVIFFLLGAFAGTSAEHLKEHEEKPKLSKFKEVCSKNYLNKNTVTTNCFVRYRRPRDCD